MEMGADDFRVFSSDSMLCVRDLRAVMMHRPEIACTAHGTPTVLHGTKDCTVGSRTGLLRIAAQEGRGHMFVDRRKRGAPGLQLLIADLQGKGPVGDVD